MILTSHCLPYTPRPSNVKKQKPKCAICKIWRKMGAGLEYHVYLMPQPGISKLKANLLQLIPCVKRCSRCHQRDSILSLRAPPLLYTRLIIATVWFCTVPHSSLLIFYECAWNSHVGVNTFIVFVRTFSLLIPSVCSIYYTIGICCCLHLNEWHDDDDYK